MITVYKKKSISRKMIVEKFNDTFFNKHTAEMLDERADSIISQIDKSRMIDKYSIASRFDGTRLNIDKLSTGCKTALNIMYNPDRILMFPSFSDSGIDGWVLLFNEAELLGGMGKKTRAKSYVQLQRFLKPSAKEVAEITFDHSMKLIMIALLTAVKEFFALTENQMSSFVQQFIGNLPSYLRKPLEACAEQLVVA